MEIIRNCFSLLKADIIRAKEFEGVVVKRNGCLRVLASSDLNQAIMMQLRPPNVQNWLLT